VRIYILISGILIIFGISYAILSIKLHRRSLYLFFAALFLQTGLFLFLIALQVIRIGFPQAWPLLPIFTGTALFLAGWHRYKVFKVNYIVLSAAFVILGAVMMIFALDLISLPLAQFVRDWWFLLVLLGVILVLISLGVRNARRNRRRSPPKP